MSYFLIYCSEDGDTRVYEYTAEQVEALLNGPEAEHQVGDFFDKVPDRDTAYWSRKVLLIKGEIVVPKVKEVVTRVTLEES